MAEEKIVDRHHLWNNLHTAPNEDIHPLPCSLEELKQTKRTILVKNYDPIEKAFLENALTASEGNITRAAQHVGMQRSNFSALMKKHNITPPQK